ncbi:anaerobic ribonucleoside-triphosphate reductase activating protein [Enterococcus sp. PF1-24]|uniref:anaerobic ribonucleoside-triphosphate reductase activating protein n=1 Tax=unclassified Enterococcus TaxID=2608891 RepID=UPI00247710C6|nr:MULTISPECIES: anaerobic ribonucleoside-triphosphate reductase activating protein [unclassified Enterococcus]MDH6363950.1 anaerobic ribonucleoside-triphosphate reductase activating protein [Enterococcus sp. PFB1-1]MDH6401051.1 anaerobic ribonucleoside-triphosphate reductase activating protein [Enterococcus sp. PF1-24]
MKIQNRGFYADYKPMNFVDGEGVRCSLYVSGCPFNCKGCYNPKLQDGNYGAYYNSDLENQILKDLDLPYVQGLSLMGGEPFANLAISLPLVKRVREIYSEKKDIWVWTGYLFEQLINSKNGHRELLEMIDVLVDGPFVEGKYHKGLFFRGSSNQRIIDVPKSLELGELSLWQAGNYLLKEVP